MEKARILRWLVESDVEVTRALYRELDSRGASECGCEDCKNYMLIGDSAFPPRVLEFLSRLGIDPLKEVEVCRFNREESGLHLYGGRFHFIGKVLEGEDGWRDRGEGSKVADFEEVESGFAIGISRDPQLVRESFDTSRCVQLDFFAVLPWLSSFKEPD